MNVGRVDHTAIAVRDMDAALDRYYQLLGVTPSERALVVDQGVEVAFLSLGDTQLELICPVDDASGVARFIDQRGESLHHIGILVDDIRQELKLLARSGFALIDREPRRGLHGAIAFIHPRATGGVLIELVQHAREGYRYSGK